MKDKDYDFSGWATKNDLQCTDGRVIRRNAFAHCDGKKIPLLWGHDHNDPVNVLGHAILENTPKGVKAYGYFNDTERGQQAKSLVEHGDITNLSIWANHLKQQGADVIHGDIKEVSLVYAGANPGAVVTNVIMHADNDDENAIVFTGEEGLSMNDDGFMHADDDDESETIADIIETMSPKQQDAVYAIVGSLANQNEDDEEEYEDDDDDDDDIKHTDYMEGDNVMKRNVFENNNGAANEESQVLSHADELSIITDATRGTGSMKQAFEKFKLSHADYGIDNINFLMPEAHNLNTTPEFIKRDTGWVGKVISGVHKTPFSRIKSVFADITEDEARAKGYLKGNLKKEEVFSLLKRTTSPTTVYKKQKIDRDDVIDITDFDVVAWIKLEMRIMLDEEIARAILVGDGRLASSDDKINEQNIRPISKDEELYTIQCPIKPGKNAPESAKASAFITAAIRARKNYKGSGNPSLYTTEDMVTSCLLLEDKIGNVKYKTVQELAVRLRVKEIITVEPMESATGADGNPLVGIIVNLTDYNLGADKGGSINMFDDFDIDFNQQKYLMETRCSGALVKPKSAIAFTMTNEDAGQAQ